MRSQEPFLSTSEIGKPVRILIVDDYQPWQDFTSTMLRKYPELKVVEKGMDGVEAVLQTKELHPDLVLLDIGLPKLNGIEVARRIREDSPISKILFVSENRSLEIVEAALNTGAGGYVLKSDAGRDLLPGVRAVLAGKRFVSTNLAGCDLIAPTRPQSVESNRHELGIYADDAAFMDDLTQSIRAALENGSAVLVVATESHRANLLQKLRTDGVDIDAASEGQFYIPLDVSDSLPTGMDTSNDENGFAEGLSGAIVQALRTAKEKHRHLAVG